MKNVALSSTNVHHGRCVYIVSADFAQLSPCHPEERPRVSSYVILRRPRECAAVSKDDSAADQKRSTKMPKPTLALILRTCVVVAIAFLLLVDAWHEQKFWPRPDVLFVAGGYATWGLFLALALALTPTRAWGLLVTILAVFPGWLLAYALAGMLVTCDMNMRPFLVQMLGLAGAGYLIPEWGVVAVIFIAIVISLVGFGVSRLIKRQVPMVWPVVALVMIPIIFAATQIMMRAQGLHPVPGNCVI
jgi:hypothetical protein